MAVILVKESILKYNINNFITHKIQSDESPVFSSHTIDTDYKKILEVIIIDKEIALNKIEEWKQCLIMDYKILN